MSDTPHSPPVTTNTVKAETNGSDALAHLRTLKQKLTRTRLMAMLAALGAFLALGFWASNSAITPVAGNHVARIRIQGMILENAKRLQAIENAAKDAHVKAIMITIDSPGGGTAASEALYEEIRKAAQKKPTFAVIEGMAASGGYITAIATDKIFARGNSITGSIGVLFQWAEVGELLKTVGVKMDEVKSSPLKATPNMISPPPAEARKVIEELVNDSYQWFSGLVVERRKLNESQKAATTNGQVFSGRQALTMNLIDSIGGEQEARLWLEKEKAIPANLPTRDWYPKSTRDRLGLGDLALAWGAERLGITSFTTFLRGIDGFNRGYGLDGLVSIWQPHAH